MAPRIEVQQFSATSWTKFVVASNGAAWPRWLEWLPKVSPETRAPKPEEHLEAPPALTPG